MADVNLPSHAQTVIIGGGSLGCNMAYHLTKLGRSDVVVLEQNQLTSGSTWHAAGLIAPAVLLSEADCEIYTHGRDLYANLEQETGMATGFRDVGYMQIAASDDRVHEMRRAADFMGRHGIPIEEISRKEAQDLAPIADMSDIKSAFLYPKEGRANPVDITMSLAKGARMGGAKIFEGTGVDEILSENGAVTGVKTTDGEVITCESVVICGGMWSRQLGAKAGINLPLQAAEHYYLITEAIEGMSRDLPVMEDPDAYAYYREEGGGLMIGLFEPNDAAPWNVDAIPKDFVFGEIEPDWDRMAPHLEVAYSRVPSTLEIGVKKFFCGPESFTPDLAPLVGETPELQNCFVATGLNSSGILNGAGVANVLAHWIVDGIPPIDVTHINVNRFSRAQNTPGYRRDYISQSMGYLFGKKYPNKVMGAARNVKRSALYDRLAAQGAFFTLDHGWEIADWYAPSPEKAKIDTYSWGRQNWWPYHEAEHNAARNDVVLMDVSDMTKFVVEGRDACAFLSRLSCNEVDVEPGHIVYTQWTNDKGGIEGDLTVTRLEHDRFMVICGELARGHTEMRMRRNILPDEFVTIFDDTAGITQINLHGPKARILMETLTHADMSNENFPFLAARNIDIGYAEVLAIRVTYCGELGWELHIPSTSAVQVYDQIVEAGAPFGLRHAGIQALNSLRMEKGYRDFGHDIDNTDNPIEAGLGFAVKLDKPGGFIGRDALATVKDAGVSNRRMVQLLLGDPEPLLFGNEPIYLNGEYAGYVGSAGYGFTLGGAVGLGFAGTDQPLTAEIIKSGTWEIEIAGQRFAATASLRPLLDPTMERIKC